MKKVLLETRQLRPRSAEGTFLSPSVDLKIESGSVVFLNGYNGSGKSSVLKTILGLHKHHNGQVTLYIPQSDIQYLPQLGNITFHLPLTLLDVLDGSLFEPQLLGGLDLAKKWNTASGGERQKVLLAAVLARRPQLLILDEPFNHVDKDSVLVLEKALINYFEKNPESALLIISHRSVKAFEGSAILVDLR